MNLILLGAPGSGKGTQAENISNRLKIPIISTGNIIRDLIKKNTILGDKIKKYIDIGKLVPDNLVIEIIKNRIENNDCKSGFILDGFPRTITQAETLDNMNVKIDKVLNMEVADKKILERLSGRRVCENCGSSYHVYYKPAKINGFCDICGSKIVHREDDQTETVASRLAVYHQETEPLKKYYELQHKLYVVEGKEEVKETMALTLSVLGI